MIDKKKIKRKRYFRSWFIEEKNIVTRFASIKIENESFNADTCSDSRSESFESIDS